MVDLRLQSRVSPALASGDHAPGDQDIAVPRHSLARRSRGWLMWLVIIGLLAWSWGPTEMSRATSLVTDWRNMTEFGRAFLRPVFYDLDIYLADMVVTIQ